MAPTRAPTSKTTTATPSAQSAPTRAPSFPRNTRTTVVATVTIGGVSKDEFVLDSSPERAAFFKVLKTKLGADADVRITNSVDTAASSGGRRRILGAGDSVDVTAEASVPSASMTGDELLLTLRDFFADSTSAGFSKRMEAEVGTPVPVSLIGIDGVSSSAAAAPDAPPASDDAGAIVGAVFGVIGGIAVLLLVVAVAVAAVIVFIVLNKRKKEAGDAKIADVASGEIEMNDGVSIPTSTSAAVFSSNPAHKPSDFGIGCDADDANAESSNSLAQQRQTGGANPMARARTKSDNVGDVDFAIGTETKEPLSLVVRETVAEEETANQAVSDVARERVELGKETPSLVLHASVAEEETANRAVNAVASEAVELGKETPSLVPHASFMDAMAGFGDDDAEDEPLVADLSFATAGEEVELDVHHEDEIKLDVHDEHGEEHDEKIVLDDDTESLDLEDSNGSVHHEAIVLEDDTESLDLDLGSDNSGDEIHF